MILKEKERRKIPGAFCFARPGSYKYVISFDVTSLYPHMVMMWNISIEKLLKDIEYITDDIQKLHYQNIRHGKSKMDL